MVSIRIKQLNEIDNNHINDEDGDFVALWPDNSTNGNIRYFNLIRSAVVIKSNAAGHTLGLLRECPKGVNC